jgi:hypothetical protein
VAVAAVVATAAVAAESAPPVAPAPAGESLLEAAKTNPFF